MESGLGAENTHSPKAAFSLQHNFAGLVPHRRMAARSASHSPLLRYSSQLLAAQRLLNISVSRKSSVSPQPQCAGALDHVYDFALDTKPARTGFNSVYRIFFSLWRGHDLLALLLLLLLCGTPGHHPLTDFCLLLRRQHLENLASLYTLQPLEHRDFPALT
jgi:hypothetical protein